MNRLLMVALVSVVLAACTPRIVRTDLQSERLLAPAKLRLACDYRLQLVADARPEEEAGRLSKQAFRFRQPEAAVQSQLAAAGWSQQDDATPVRLHIRQLYLATNGTTKIPVAVYQVAVGSDAPVILRAQPASMNWNGTADEAYAAYSSAMAEANTKLVEHLNARCKR